MMKGKRIITGIMLVLVMVCISGCKKISKAAIFTYEEMMLESWLLQGLQIKEGLMQRL